MMARGKTKTLVHLSQRAHSAECGLVPERNYRGSADGVGQ